MSDESLPPRNHPDYMKLYQRRRRQTLPAARRQAEQDANRAAHALARNRRAFLGDTLKACAATAVTLFPGPARPHPDDRLEDVWREVRALQAVFSRGYEPARAQEVNQRARALQDQLQHWQVKGVAAQQAQRLAAWCDALILDAGLPGEPAYFFAHLEPRAVRIVTFWLCANDDPVNTAKACLVHGNVHATACDQDYCRGADRYADSLEKGIQSAQTAYTTLLLGAAGGRHPQPVAVPLFIESVAQFIRFIGFYGAEPESQRLKEPIERLEALLTESDEPGRRVQILRELSFYYRLRAEVELADRTTQHFYLGQAQEALDEADQHSPGASRLSLLRPRINLWLAMDKDAQELVDEWIALVDEAGWGAHHCHQLQLWQRSERLWLPQREVSGPTYTSPYIKDLYRPEMFANL